MTSTNKVGGGGGQKPEEVECEMIKEQLKFPYHAVCLNDATLLKKKKGLFFKGKKIDFDITM